LPAFGGVLTAREAAAGAGPFARGRVTAGLHGPGRCGRRRAADRGHGGPLM